MAVLFFLMGGAWVSWQAEHRLDAQWPVERHGEELWVSGHISDIPMYAPELQRFMFRPLDGEQGDIRVSWYRQVVPLRAGDCWSLKLRMRTPRGASNPGGFDYEGWLFQQGIAATAYVREAKACDAAPGWNIRLQSWRQEMADVLSGYLPEHPVLPFVQALVLGHRAGFTEQHWTVLRRTGTSHLMAISGLHIGMVAAAAYWFALFCGRLLGLAGKGVSVRRFALLSSASMATVYVMFSGFGLPAQRALLMLIVLYAALYFSRRVSLFQTLSVALLLVLLIDPFAATNTGFWLSFLAVAVIGYLFSNRWQTMSQLKGFLALQCMLTLIMLPVGLYAFGEASLLSIPVNLLLVPLFTVALPLLLLVVAGVFTGIEFADYLLMLMAEGLGWAWALLDWLAVQSEGALITLQPALGAVILATLGALWIMAPSGWPARWLGLCLWLPLLPWGAPDTGPGLRITVLDVGQGLSVVAEVDGRVMVYDAGPAFKGGFDAGKMIVAPYLRFRGYREIDRFVLSHGDLDHRGGLESLQATLPIHQTLGVSERDPCIKGQGWQWGDVVFETLHPDGGDWQGNDGSCVLAVRYGAQRILLSGDIEKTAEQHLVATASRHLKADILLAPHHGSASSSTWPFLKSVMPSLVVFSAGWRNRWHFPRQEVVERYISLGADTLNTAETGAIIIEFPQSGDMPVVSQWREKHSRFWMQ